MWHIVAGFRQFLFPSRCICCREILEEPEADCCNVCYNELRMINQNYCQKCGKLHETKGDLCFDCRRNRHYFTQGRGVFVYEEPIKSSLFGLKFFKATWIGEKCGEILADYYQEEGLWDIDLVVPVPLHWYRFIGRGYNQAEIIVRSFSKRLRLPLDDKVLCRKKMTLPQKDLTDEERVRNLELAFRVKNQEVIQGKRILLVDDIYTTGSTIDSCAKVLLECGAIEVYFLTVAIGKGY